MQVVKRFCLLFVNSRCIPLVAVIAVGWGAGLLAQYAMSKSGADKAAEKLIKSYLPE